MSLVMDGIFKLQVLLGILAWTELTPFCQQVGWEVTAAQQLTINGIVIIIIIIIIIITIIIIPLPLNHHHHHHQHRHHCHHHHHYHHHHPCHPGGLGGHRSTAALA
jgi:membrane protein YdbS with pleckstrin-like domain